MNEMTLALALTIYVLLHALYVADIVDVRGRRNRRSSRPATMVEWRARRQQQCDSIKGHLTRMEATLDEALMRKAYNDCQRV